MKEKINEQVKEKVRYSVSYFLKHPKQYMQFFYTGHIVPATYRWKRNVDAQRRKDT